MSLKNFIVLLLSLSLLFGIVSARIGGAGGNEVTECTDDADNDNDGQTDGADSGCVKPYWEDGSEADIYDLDATWVFSGARGKSNPLQWIGRENASVYYGLYLNYSGSEVRDNNYPSKTGVLTEMVVESAGSDGNNFGGGSIYLKNISKGDNQKIEPRGNYDEIIDNQHNQDINTNSIRDTCGNGLRDTSATPAETARNCPQDFGMPYDMADGIDHYSSSDPDDSKKNISYTIGWVNVQALTKIKNYEDLQDDLKRDRDMLVREFKSYDTSNDKETVDISATGYQHEGSTKIFKIDSVENAPDFSVGSNGNKIIAHYPKNYTEYVSGDSSGSTFTDWDIYSTEISPVYKKKTYYTCSDEGSSFGNDCAGDTVTPKQCSGSTSNDVVVADSGTASSATGTVTGIENNTYESSGDGILDEVSTDTFTLEVTYENKGSTSTKDKVHKSCSGGTSSSTTYQKTDCTSNSDVDSCSSNTVWKEETGNNYNKWGSNDTVFKIHRVSTFSDELFSSKPDVNKTFEFGGTTEVDRSNGKFPVTELKNILFYNDFSNFDPNFDGTKEGLENGIIASGSGYYVNVSMDDYGNKTFGNSPAASFTEMSITVDGGNFSSDIGSNDDRAVVDADGIKGSSDGYVAIKKDSSGTWKFAGSSQNFGDTSTRDGSETGWVPTDQIDPSNLACPSWDGSSNYEKCVAAIDFYTKKTGWERSGFTSSAWGYHTATGNPHVLDESMGVNKLYNYLVSGSPDGGGSTPNSDYDGGGGPGPGSCGDQSNEYWAYMEGPEVKKEHVEEYGGDYQACVTDSSPGDPNKCVVNGDVVSEGTVKNVANPDVTKVEYEKGGNSPDWEVCLNINGDSTGGTGDTDTGDNDDYDDDGTVEEVGGELYDLDSETAQNYLRNDGSGLVDTSSSDSSKIGFYWRNNQDPNHPTHNQEGGNDGIALEDDCGNNRFDSISCSDNQANENRNPTFYSFFDVGKFDEDYHPQGKDESTEVNHLFEGQVNKLEEDSDQYESGNQWNNSDGSSGDADRWAITSDQSFLISNRGTPYAPADYVPSDSSKENGKPTYYHPGARSQNMERTTVDDSSIAKRFKVFGNSFAATAGSGLGSVESGSVSTGDGVWIDPDDLRSYSRGNKIQQNWRDQLKFNIDITGADSGLGLRVDSMDDYNFRDEGRAVYGDVRFGSSSELKPPMCGDDSLEYLVEEMGEAENPSQFSGVYACADSRNKCVYSAQDGSVEFYSSNDYKQTDELDENVGRLKQDKEICRIGDRFQGGQPKWWDQDFGDVDGDGNQETCDVNNLYSENGVRWFKSDYVKDHPNAVTGGIDDDWNHYLEQQAQDSTSEYSEELSDSPYTSRPDKDKNWDFSSMSPVPSGARAVGNDSVATLGFCGGDDDGEYLVTQECSTDLCQTKRGIEPVIGVAKNPDACIFDGNPGEAEYTPVDKDDRKRKIHQPGSKIKLNLGNEERTIQCFNGAWHDDWPVVFNRDNVEVPWNGSKTVGFSVINVQDQPREFKVSMVPRKHEDHQSAYQLSSFVEKDGDSFNVKIPGGEARRFNVRIRGSDLRVSNNDKYDKLKLEAEAVDFDLYGTDSLGVDVVKPDKVTSTRKSEPESVPGIGAIHIIAIVMLSSAVFFLQS